MSNQTPTSENQISYKTYCLLGGCRNSDLIAVLRYRGNDYKNSYYTYHHVGYGQAYWKQDCI